MEKKGSDANPGYSVYHNPEHFRDKIGIRIRGDSSDMPDVYSQTNVSIGQWEQWTLSWNENNFKWYRNGVTGPNSCKQWGLRGYHKYELINNWPFNQSFMGRNWFNGKLDDIRLYNRALTANEVGQLYNAHKPAPAPCPSCNYLPSD